MDPLLIALAAAGLLIGATGTWSPCGFSMIETIGPTGHTGGWRTTLAACATFAPFAVLGGAITYGLVGWAGEALLGEAGMAAAVVAAVVALAAAVAEARGLRIVPQVRRQLPVGWRSSMPMPLAAAGYGVLLGLGFTTFVLSYGVWALMGICLALGDATAGLVAGLAFGVGRALPIVVLAPLADRPSGERACETMAMRPGLLRGARAADAVALTALAGVLVAGGGIAGAAKPLVSVGADPSVAGEVLAYEGEGGQAILQVDGRTTEVPGTDPAVGGEWVAVIAGDRVEIIDRSTEKVRGSLAAGAADGLAISKDWIAVRTRKGRGDVISVAPLTKGGAPGRLRKVASGGVLSRPALSGDTLVFTEAKRSRSSLLAAKLKGSGGRAKVRRLRSSVDSVFTGPSVAGSHIAYVETTSNRQIVTVTGGRGRGKRVLSRRPAPPTVWTTALAKDVVYVTLVAKGGVGSITAVKR